MKILTPHLNLYIASDHAGYDLKNHVVNYLKSQNINLKDMGPFSPDSVDYPDYADLVCKKIIDSTLSKSNEKIFGILICGSGQGMAMRANKYSQIRAALVYNDDIAQLSREHNDANIICLGSRFCSSENAEKWISIFLNSHFSEGRHRQRVDKTSQPT